MPLHQHALLCGYRYIYIKSDSVYIVMREQLRNELDHINNVIEYLAMWLCIWLCMSFYIIYYN